MPEKGWDYVVIGAGAAGCVVAGRLSQMLPDARIALVEAGRERLGLTTKVPGIAFVASTFAKQNWNYQTEPVPALNGRRFFASPISPPIRSNATRCSDITRTLSTRSV